MNGQFVKEFRQRIGGQRPGHESRISPDGLLTRARQGKIRKFHEFEMRGGNAKAILKITHEPASELQVCALTPR